MDKTDKRKSERVQFFSLGDEEQIQPIWVFRRTSPDSILGLLLDFSAAGVQVITNKANLIRSGLFQLTVHLDDKDSAVLILNQKWSQAEGTLYIRNGFAFEVGEVDAIPSVEQLINAHAAGDRWLRCELLALDLADANHSGTLNLR